MLLIFYNNHIPLPSNFPNACPISILLLSGGSELRWVMQIEQDQCKFPLSYHHEVFLDAGRVEMLMSVLQFSYFNPTLHLAGLIVGYDLQFVVPFLWARHLELWMHVYLKTQQHPKNCLNLLIDHLKPSSSISLALRLITSKVTCIQSVWTFT